MEFIIHEFSTGITPEGNEQQWVSKGFTGRYMNMTMNVVPSVVERVIANNGFAVAEGTSSEKPAIIGRVVVGPSEQESWSVIAFVTRGEDEYGRSFGFNRYFLCQGMKNLWMLIEWLEAYRQNKGHYPVFNPFKLRQPAQPNRWETPHRVDMSSDAPQWIYEKTPAIAPWHEVLSMAEINDFAERKANGQPEQIAWALDVEALEQPERFLVIKPASARAAEILQQPVAMSTRSHSAYTSIDEAAIKGAIKGLINSSQVNESLFETLITSIRVVKNELESDIRISKYWNDIFDKQGASNALSQNISSPQMNRLLALRAILIPETLYQYLQWLNIEKANHSTSKCSESLNFQQQLKLIAKDLQKSKPEIFTDFINNLIDGIKSILYKIYKENSSKEAIKKLSLESEIWVLSKDGIWNFCKELFQKMIAEDLQLNRGSLNDYQLNGKEWDKIWHDIRRYRDKQYIIRLLPFAELFDAIGNPALAACFYQLAEGEVPAEIYKQVYTSRYGSQPFGIHVRRAQTTFEKFVEIALPVTAVILGVAAVLTFAFLLYYGIDQLTKSKINTISTSPSPTDLPSLNGITFKSELQKMGSEKYSNAESSFLEKTKQSLKIIVKQLEEAKKKPEDIKPKLVKVLQSDFIKSTSEKRPEELNIDKLIKMKSYNLKIEDSKKEMDNWIAAIYHYQIKHSDLQESADGILSKPTTTKYEKAAAGQPPSTGWCLIKDVENTLGQKVDICKKSDTASSATPSSSPTATPTSQQSVQRGT